MPGLAIAKRGTDSALFLPLLFHLPPKGTAVLYEPVHGRQCRSLAEPPQHNTQKHKQTKPSPTNTQHNSIHPIPPLHPTSPPHPPPQSHKDRREGLLAQIDEARRQYTELADSIQRANDRLQTVTEEMAIGGGGVTQPSARSMANMAGNRSMSQYA